MSSVHPAPRPAYSYRDDPSVPRFDESYWHVVMDDRCGLCAKTARRIAQADTKDRVRLVPIRSELGRSLMEHYDLNAVDPQTWLLIRDGRAYGGLTAAMNLFPSLSMWYAPLAMVHVVPARWRDRLYAKIARHRYRWFGHADLCAMPDKDVQDRLVCSDEAIRESAGEQGILLQTAQEGR